MSDPILTTTDAVIDALGGNMPVAAMFGCKTSAVSNWRAFGVFPSHTDRPLNEALAKIGKRASAALWSKSSKRMREPHQAAAS